MSVLIGIAFKSLLIAALTLGLLQLMKRRSAAERSWIAHAGLFALVLMAVAPLVVPTYSVEGPALLGSAKTEQVVPDTKPAPVALPAVKAGGKLDVQALALSTVAPQSTPKAAAVAPSALSTTATTMVLYAIPAAILLFITFLALARLVTLRARADVLVDGHWLSALARAQRRMGFKHGTALLTSDELASPISWGLVRPVILLNTRAVEAQGEAEAIIAHELAHVARMDWIKLLLARVATALFWFNPLVWLLARESHQLREEAADDAVLASDIPDTDYAQLLVGVARHECPGLFLGAHGVAPSKSSLARRVSRVLDGKIMRGPVAGSFAAGVFVGAIVIAAPLAALTMVPNGSLSKKATVASAKGQKAEAFAPYYPEAAPADLPTIIGQGVSTSVQTAVAAIRPTIKYGNDGDFEMKAPSGATVSNINGMTVAKAPNGATTTIYAPDANGRRRVVMRGANGSVMTFADASEIAGGVNFENGRAGKHQDSLVDKAIEMKALNVTPEYIAAIRAASPSLRDADTDDIVGMKAVGVTPDYIRQMASAGFRNLDADDITSARAVGVTPDYVRSMASIGFSGDLDDYVEMRALGITPAYAEQFRRAGYKLDRDQLVKLKANGIAVDALRRAPPEPPRPPRPPRTSSDDDGE